MKRKDLKEGVVESSKVDEVDLPKVGEQFYLKTGKLCKVTYVNVGKRRFTCSIVD